MVFPASLTVAALQAIAVAECDVGVKSVAEISETKRFRGRNFGVPHRPRGEKAITD